MEHQREIMNQKEIKEILETALQYGASFAEIFLEQKESTVIGCESSKIENINTGLDLGIGIRVICGEKTAYLHTNKIDLQHMKELAAQAGQAVGAGDPAIAVKPFLIPSANCHQPAKLPPIQVPFDEKIKLLKQADRAARSTSPFISQVSLSYSDVTQRVLIANSLGTLVQDERIRVRMACNSIATQDGQVQTGFASLGGACGFELFSNDAAEKMGKESAERAMTLLSAQPCPTGQMTVVLGSEAGGTMVHEACGHGLEGDLVQKGLSAYAGKLGEKVASEKITVIDDATVPGKYGSYAYDDEGNPGRKNVLIENGILIRYMNDYQTAQKTEQPITGNGRRQSYREKPLTRMSNTYIAPGTDSVEEMIASVEYGLYVKKMGGGQVNSLNGDYVFDVSEGYLIENGKITVPVRGATLAGNGPKSLQMVEMVGNDLGYAIGTCGKNGQSAPVADAQPTLKINGLTVGGTGNAKR